MLLHDAVRALASGHRRDPSGGTGGQVVTAVALSPRGALQLVLVLERRPNDDRWQALAAYRRVFHLRDVREQHLPQVLDEVHVRVTDDRQSLDPSNLDVPVTGVEVRCLEGERGEVEPLAAALSANGLGSLS